MKRVCLNMNLMERLFEVAAVPVLETLSAAGIAQSSLWGWMDSEKSGDWKRMRQGGIPVLALIDLCNAMRIPVRKLFIEEGQEETVPLRAELVLPRSKHIPCSFNMDAFRKSFGIRSEARMSVTSMLEKLGVSYTVYVAWIADAKNLRVQSLLDVCNEFGYDFFRFMVDENSSALEESELKETGTGAEQEAETLKKENAVILREMESMGDELEKISKEKDALEKENALLKIQASELAHEIHLLKGRLQLLEEGTNCAFAESGLTHNTKKME